VTSTRIRFGFLLGDAAGPKPKAIDMWATLWVETVQADIEVGPLKAVESQKVSPSVPAGAPAPTFLVTSKSGTAGSRSVTVTYAQIQCTQNVSLNFATLAWPHVSVAVLVPTDPIPHEVETG
jgi:hypothetical protein